ncbi:MAG: type II toxin-antitoxin system HicB family antitoxin [Deltaproteobacteria bacterium]|nr:type II toxin-antitoxin system HicB family antitoxin [Deltaproteobacteria bacterium]
MCLKLEGNLSKEGKWWAVCIPALRVYTQGKSKKDALFMAKDAVELLIDRAGFTAEARLLSNNQFVLWAAKSKNDRYLVALLLKKQRAKYGLSLQQVADRLGVSVNAYAQYEQARAVPSIAKIEEFIHAMNDRAHVVLDVLDEAEAA